MALLKSGWLWRQTSILKHWKLNWCDLWIDGTLAFYKTDSRREFEHRVGLKTSCVSVKSGLECAERTWSPNIFIDLQKICAFAVDPNKALKCLSPPENHPRENLVVVQLRDSTTVILCANSEDEALAWKLTILEFVYDPYNDSYPSVPMDGHNTIYLAPGSGTHHILIQRDPYDGIGEQVALGLLAGMAAGAAMRSFLWMPFFFC
ncbi:pleckstrin homology domain-containing family B member 1-like isoform X2 [Oncorhynchus kisutch]|uniref:pleckstrin homology domain-containing family B member 1-like isoform X2 n=1 Tax=Oncorhynchus kisutch TaxID=8019 RepID=UPI0012DC12A6|nr:pleckstrin homology domain-containing family B member 1-like isoform X2 [Oncorhynchus kisutch]